MVDIQNQKQCVLLDSPQQLPLAEVREIIEDVRQELDEHRGVINDNTDEIQANFTLLCELDKKLEKISQRVDELALAVYGKKEQKQFAITPLTQREKEVFMALYVLGEVQPFVTYKQMARKVCMNESLVASYVTNIVEKGIPILKKYDAGIAYIKLDDEFRQAQAKQNLVGVNTLLSYWL